MSTSAKPYPVWICIPCGKRYGRRMPRGIYTVHNDTCDVCGARNVGVTEPRDFGHLRPEWAQHRPKEAA